MSLFKRLFSNKKSDSDNAESSYFPERELPVDEMFTYNFNKNGGKFLYCENMDEVLESFDNILLENDWYEKDVFCFDEELSKRFKGYNLNFIQKTPSAFFLSTCESLIADKGSILFSSNQMKEKKLRDFPQNFIVLATTSQLVKTISEGLRKIKNKSKNKIPSNITTLKDFGVESEKENDFMTYGNSTKNLYLLLLEDL